MALKKNECLTNGYCEKHLNFDALPSKLLKKLLTETLDDAEASALAFSITQDFLEGFEIEDTPEGKKAAIIAIDEAIHKAILLYP